jgi:hypothetical protein
LFFDNKIPKRAAMETAAGIAVKLWVSIARNDAQTPWVKPGRFLPFPDKMAFFSLMVKIKISFGYHNV